MISPMKDKRDKTIDKKGKKSWTSDNEITIVQRVESSLVTMRGVKRNKEDMAKEKKNCNKDHNLPPSSYEIYASFWVSNRNCPLLITPKPMGKQNVSIGK